MIRNIAIVLCLFLLVSAATASGGKAGIPPAAGGTTTDRQQRNITPGNGDYEGMHCPMNQSGRPDTQSSLFFDSSKGVCDLDGEICHAETCSIFKNTGDAR